MIKGVNRHMIEVADTGSPYFERALLVVQSDLEQVEESTLHAAAKDFLQQADSCGHVRHKRRQYILSRFLLATCSAALGAALTLLVQSLT